MGTPRCGLFREAANRVNIQMSRLFGITTFPALAKECELVHENSKLRDSGRAESTPFGERGGAALLEIGPAVEVAILVEVIEHGRVDGGELLQALHLEKSRHRQPLPSRRLM
ncbi:MAG: hypothetical protein SGJ21_12260 [Alphaproteobacteria bacterium]|nr:hypothetical protein [Alphaproteobacteria bacterium]